ncbi:MAG: hypothetical protein H8D47_04030, partial [Planctomycetes bacterium]|nr:hypothetical protein [Planctomycetota bacterium]
MSKRIAILGSTGSIGKNALRVIDALGSDYEVVALTAHNSVELLAEQVKRYKPSFAAITNPGAAASFADLVSGTSVKVLSGAESMVALACLDEVDIVLTAVVGAAGLLAGVYWGRGGGGERGELRGGRAHLKKKNKYGRSVSAAYVL